MTFTRVFVIAPMRSTCVQLEELIQMDILPEALQNTLLMRECGPQLDAAIAGLPQGGYGVIAGTGAGKSAGIRELCRKVLGPRLRVGIVTKEHEGGEAIRDKNVLCVTPGIALLMIISGEIKATDLVVYDEVHQTSDQLELVMALLKMLGITSVWMSATIDATRYMEYLEAKTLIKCDTRDPEREAEFNYHRGDSADKWLRDNLKAIADGKRGVAVFVPTRKDAELLAKQYNGKHGVHVGFYHAGVPAEKLRDYMRGNIPRPYFLCMTPAGSSSLNITGLDWVGIVDRQVKEEIRNGKRHRVTVPLDNNMLLQMIGRVRGRAIGGVVDIITERPDFDVHDIEPETPEFKLGGNLELLALTTARMGIDVRRLELIGELDRTAYQQVFDRFVRRGLIVIDGEGKPRLTSRGSQIERMPVSPAWGEIIIEAQALGIGDLLLVASLTACTDELYRLTGHGWKASDDGLSVDGSDHLTSYNIVAEAIRQFGKLRHGQYQVRDNKFETWCRTNNYSQKEIGNIVQLFGSLVTKLGLKLPSPRKMPSVEPKSELHGVFIELLALVQSMDYVRDEKHGELQVYGNNRSGVTQGKSTLGFIKRWSNARGNEGATVEGTDIPDDVVRQYAARKLLKVLRGHGGTYEVHYDLTFAGQSAGELVDECDEGSLPPEIRNELAWQEWATRPSIVVPDPADAAAVVPDIVVCAYGADAVTGSPLQAYGTVAPIATRTMPADPWFQPVWTRDRAQADRLYASAIARLESVRTEAQAAAERARKAGELEPLVREANTLRQHAAKLYDQHCRDDRLSPELRNRLMRHRRLPVSPGADVLRQWIGRARPAIREAYTALEAAEQAHEAMAAEPDAPWYTPAGLRRRFSSTPTISRRR